MSVSLLEWHIWCLAAIIAAAGALHLLGPKWLSEPYRHWGYSARFRLIVGLLDTMTAILLVAPEMRVWGIGLAALIAFFTVVALLDHERYRAAAPVALLMVALIPALLSLPHHDRFAPPPQTQLQLSAR